MENEIVIKPHFPYSDYYKVTLELFFSKPVVWLYFPTLIVLIFISNEQSRTNAEMILTTIVLAIVFLVAIFISKRLAVKRALGNSKMKEDISIVYNSEFFEEKGETFTVRYLWKNILKIVEKKQWFLICINKNHVKLLRKEDLTAEQLIRIRVLFSKLPTHTKLQP